MTKIIPLVLGFIFLLFLPVFAQEEITITTYYPSPYGAYRDLQVGRALSVGDVNHDGNFDNNDFIRDVSGDPATGTLALAGDIRIGNSGLTCGAANAGAMRYNSGTRMLEYCDGIGPSWKTASMFTGNISPEVTLEAAKSSGKFYSFGAGYSLSEWSVCFLTEFNGMKGSGAFDDGCKISAQAVVPSTDVYWGIEFRADGGEKIRCSARCLK